MQSFDEIRDYAKNVLSEKRFLHTLSVAEEAKELALIWGEDIDKAYLAALVHDIAKEMPFEASKEILKKAGLQHNFSRPLIHGPVAEYMARGKFGINDEDVLNAIRYHSTGRVGMSLLEKIIFVADFTEPRRLYQDSKEVRELSRKDLDAAMLLQCDRCIKFLIDTGKVVNTLTVDLRNSLITQQKRGKDK
ncbi:MAG: bis(5'-nucleosyl)-tetraphosphatase (symmetrical) YqeK [Clostridia bacterium]|nr:bis(5'-nucleosyl)-tetraphosphatase (symmetrical) YqeK [Clostridia bacterium]